MNLAQGTRLGPYEILAPLGAGGMGEVYRARDTRLGRDVAVKVLPAEFAADPERLRRFEQEARATAALDHPNILAVFDIGTHEGTPYIVEQLLDGESLRQRLRGGALTPSKTVEFGVQIAQGLAAAHEKGIVHRDLKPENLFVTKEGRIRILDFGLARLRPEAETGCDRSQAATADSPTREGKILGTPGYMAPEQIRGHAADPRSDLFAFGVVLYEMLSGKKAFDGTTATDTAAAILKEDPAPLGARVTPALGQIVRRCLEKRPEDRFGSARDLAFALEAVARPESAASTPGESDVPRHRRRWLWAAAAAAAVALLAAVGGMFLRDRSLTPKTVPARTQRIVVLPFENLGAPEDAYFASGMTEEITSRLANVRGLAVISRTTAMQYERTRVSVKQIGAELGVDYVLEGSVRWEHGQGRASRVRITPQLIRVADDTHVWTDRYDRDLADVFSIQSDVAESAVRAMGVALLPHERERIQEVSTDDQEAYDLYLRAMEARGDRGQSRLRLLQSAVERDPRFAQAWARLALTRLYGYWVYYDRSPQQLTLAKEEADRALALRPDLPESHNALASYYYYGIRDYPRALEEFTAALKINASDHWALSNTAYVLKRQGRWGESVTWLSRAVEVDPKDAGTMYNLALGYYLDRRYADADRTFQRAIDLDLLQGNSYADKAWVQVLWKGDVRQAQAILDKASRIDGLRDEFGYVALETWRVAMFRRDYEMWLRLAEAELHTLDCQDGYWPATLMKAQVLMLSGQRDLARRAFEEARLELEQKLQKDPDDSRFHSSLGVAYAGLGRRDEAVKEAKRGCELMPASRDALLAIYRVEDLALAYTMVGQNSEAIATLDDLLSRSGARSPHVLRLDPRYDPLRADPRFQALLKKYEVKE